MGQQARGRAARRTLDSFPRVEPVGDELNELLGWAAEPNARAQRGPT
jgi:hypothetical protein